MPSSDFHVSKLSLAYAKIVATPTPTSWSQVYNAGSLFATLSLTVTQQNKEEIALPIIGKDLFNNLEAEFFTLEEKTLQTIKTAIKKGFENIPPCITADACLAFFKDNMLYLFIIGKGKIIMKRNEKLGTLLEKKDTDPQILTASGFLQQNDIILLQTDHFTQNIAEKNITAAFELQLPNDIAESLSPHVHEKEDGSQAAIIIAYNGTVKALSPINENTQLTSEEPIPLEQKKELQEEDKEITKNKRLPAFHSLPSFLKLQKKLNIPLRRLTHLQKILLSVSLIILILLIVSIIFTKKKQEDAKSEALYQQIYVPAQKNYDEGKALKKLNQPLAHDDFIKAEQILKKNIDKFKTNSPEQTKLQALLDQVEAELNTTTPVNKISPKTVDVGDFDLLNIEKKGQALALSQDDTTVYLLTEKAVTAIDKTSGSKKDILTNNNDWTSPVALSPYQGNIYILDKKTGILKFVAAQSGFSKTDYFKGTPPDLTKAQSLSIDGSIWILTQDGKILKYTKGDPDNFAATGLDKPFANPSKIFTTRDTDNLYILDNGNARIIKLSKNGAYQSQYNADILSQAKDFEIIEKDQKALILSGDKIYELPL